MGLLEDFAKINEFGVHTSACKTCKILTKLEPKEAEQLNKLLADPTIVGAAIARALTKNGHHITGDTLNRHRRGQCSGTNR